MKRILIATNSRDWPTIGPVEESIRSQGYKVIVYESDKVLSGEKKLSLSLATDDKAPVAAYDKHRFSRDSIGAAWYRRAAMLTPGAPAWIGQLQLLAKMVRDNAKVDIAGELNRLQVQAETVSLQKGVWSLIAEKRWLNAPETIQNAENKISQLAIAKDLGFEIPATVVSNSWDSIRKKLASPIIVKMPRGVLWDDKGGLKVMYSSILDDAKLDDLASVAPYPAIYQAYIPKQREWRVTVVGDAVFSAAIDTTEAAKDDWRRLQSQPEHVRFYIPKDDLDLTIKTMCLQFLSKLGLRFGAFDLITRPDGSTVFLEMNPNGQFMWLEKQLGLPISSAIGAELVKIAEQA